MWRIRGLFLFVLCGPREKTKRRKDFKVRRKKRKEGSKAKRKEKLLCALSLPLC
jgi:hypothetical protein